MHKIRLAGINAALISAFFLGLAPVFGKAAMGGDHFSPYAVVALRTGAAALLLFVIMALFNRKYLYIYGTGLLGCALAGSINGIGVACLGISLLLVLLERPVPQPPTHPHGLLSWLQPPDFPDDFYKH